MGQELQLEKDEEVVLNPKINRGLYRYWLDHYKEDSSLLRVYVDEDNDKYYIDLFEAKALRLTNDDSYNGLFEISKSILEVLKIIFKNRIKYFILKSKESKLQLKGNEQSDSLIEINNFVGFNLNNYDDNKAKFEYGNSASNLDYTGIDNFSKKR